MLKYNLKHWFEITQKFKDIYNLINICIYVYTYIYIYIYVYIYIYTLKSPEELKGC